MPMITKFTGVVVYHEELPPIKSHDRLITWSSDIMWQTENISVAKVPIANKPSRMVTCLEGPLSIKLVDPLLTWSYEITAQIKTFISPLPPFTKLGKMVIYVERLSTMKLLDPN